jgi:isopenicillin N synthase-like dioxygenase
VKEGVYFGIELPAHDPRVAAGLPLHGPNLFPERPADLAPAVLAYTAAMTALGHALLRGVALSLGLAERYFEERYTAEPLTLFRIFNYPAVGPPDPGDERWGVGEHTDYGLLTMLRQDDNAGLQVRSRRGDEWIPAPPLAGSFVCNIGDMLDRLTGGHYRSTPHRVVPSVGRDRISWPFFFDPSWDADVRPVGQGVLAGAAYATGAESSKRWDGVDLSGLTGTYGEYLLGKVGKVFPELRREVL